MRRTRLTDHRLVVDKQDRDLVLRQNRFSADSQGSRQVLSISTCISNPRLRGLRFLGGVGRSAIQEVRKESPAIGTSLAIAPAMRDRGRIYSAAPISAAAFGMPQTTLDA